MTAARRARAGGFTLVEAVIAMAVLGLLILIFHNTVAAIGQYTRLATTNTRLATALRTAQDNIDRELRQASALTVEVDRFNSDEPYYSLIRFSRLTPSGQRTVSYYQKGDRLYVKSNTTAGERKLLDNLRQVSFVYPKSDDDKVIQVNVIFQSKVLKGQQKTLQGTLTTVRIMNP